MDSCASFMVAVLCLAVHAEGIMWQLQPNAQKCLKEELQQNTLVTGEIEVIPVPGQRVDYIFRDANGQVLSQREDFSKSKFSFVTENFNTYEICVKSFVPAHVRGVPQDVYLVTKHGVEAKNYEGIAEAAKLKPIEVELRKLEDLSNDIVQDFSVMRKREEEMRDTNESTNNRVLIFSVFSMFCLLSLATWQVFYLRRYFKAKKLIE